MYVLSHPLVFQTWRKKMLLTKIFWILTPFFVISFIFFTNSLWAQRSGGGWLRPSQQQINDAKRLLPPENTMSVSRQAINNVEPAPKTSLPPGLQAIPSFLKYELNLTSSEEVRIPSVGNQASEEIVGFSIREAVEGITQRSLTAAYNRWRGYLQSELQKTNALYTGSEVNGLGRLQWFQAIMADPLKAPLDAERFTRELHKDLCDGPVGLRRGILRAAQKLDLTPNISNYTNFNSQKTYRTALKLLEQNLVDAHLLHSHALEPLSKEELRYFQINANTALTLRTSVGHTVSARASARQLILLMQKMDRAAMFEGLAKLALVTDPLWLAAIHQIPDQNSWEDEALVLEGVTGTIVRLIETQAGLIVVGGRENNTYELEKMKQVCAIIDLGGNDIYLEGTVNLDRPVLAIVDLSGNDTYRGNLPAIQGSSLMGISILVDCQGDDQYIAQHFAQGSTIGGAAALIDMKGNDVYRGIRRVQGTAIGGIGLLLDRRGDDSYRGAMWTQGVGQTLGIGILEDCTGDDTYYAGGMYFDSYPETPGYEGWGQGLGTGIRGVAAGGIGVFLEGEGDDSYEYDYIAHGGGYWMGLGFFRDFSGNDKHQGSTSVMWDGSPRRERKFQRFSTGFGCHYAAGFFFEDGGNDTYWASIMSIGFAWDCGIAFCYDFQGDDVWTGAGNGNQGQGAQASLGMLFDFKGEDLYHGSSQGYASGNITYHQLPYCGGNFSFCIDYGGKDAYGSRAANNSYVRRGTSGGFLIDRPDIEELRAQQIAAEAAKKEKERIANQDITVSATVQPE